MIKINLSRTRIRESESAFDGASPAQSFETMGGENASPLAANLLKLLFLFGGVIGLYYYEGQNIEDLNGKVARATQETEALRATLTQKTEELNSMGGIQQDSKALNDKLKLLKDLSRLRLREVKSMDYVQSVIPPKVWLTGMDIQKEKYVLVGRSPDQTAISLFVRKLEDGGYFSDVVLVKDTVVNDAGNSIREFEIVARSEVVN